MRTTRRTIGDGLITNNDERRVLNRFRMASMRCTPAPEKNVTSNRSSLTTRPLEPGEQLVEERAGQFDGVHADLASETDDGVAQAVRAVDGERWGLRSGGPAEPFGK